MQRIVDDTRHTDCGAVPDHGRLPGGGRLTVRRCPSRLWVLALTALWFLVGDVTVPVAVEMQGRLMSDMYVYEDGEGRHWRPYLSERSRLVLRRGPAGRLITFHSNVRWVSDYGSALGRDPQANVREARLTVRNLRAGLDLSAGRQFVYTNAGSVLMDGARVHYRGWRRFTLDVHAGSWVAPGDPQTVRSMIDYRTFGGRVTWAASPKIRVGLSALARYSEGAAEYHRVSLDGERTIRHGRAFGRVSYDAARRKFGEILGRVSLRQGPWYLSGEANWRAPSVRANTIFSIIDARSYTEFRANVQRTLRPGLTLVTNTELRKFEGDHSWRASVGLSRPSYSVAWLHQSGYGGSNDGIRGHVARRINSRWELYGNANVMRYYIQAEQEGRSDAHSAAAGARWRDGRGFSARAELQFLRNAVRGRDLRILLRLTRRFSLGQGARNGGRS